MAKLQPSSVRQYLKEETKRIRFPYPITEKRVIDVFRSLSQQVPCSICYKIIREGAIDMSNTEKNHESPLEITATMLARQYCPSSVSLHLLKDHSNPEFFTGIKFDMYGNSKLRSKIINDTRETTERYFGEMKTPKVETSQQSFLSGLNI